jgi:glycosyltransferase involved in cell wall biosynthesis
MRKVLFVTAFTPARSSAGQSYSLQLLNDLAGTAEVDIIYFSYKGQMFEPSHPSLKIKNSIHLSAFAKFFNCLLLPVFHPLFTVRFSVGVLRFIQGLIKSGNYDVLYFDFSQVFLYTRFVSHKNKVLMCHDVIEQKYSRHGLPFERAWVKLTEAFVLRTKNQRLLTFSDKDASLIGRLYGKKAEVVNFFLSPFIEAIGSVVETERNTFCFFGAWNRPENSEGLAWFIENVLPMINADKKFLVIGAKMPDRLAQSIQKFDSIRYLGFVDNPYPIIAKCEALIAPVFKGAGVKVKVIESLACGTPVIGSDVALEGLPNAVISYATQVNDDKRFASVINNFSFLPEKRLTLRMWFKENYRASSEILFPGRHPQPAPDIN